MGTATSAEGIFLIGALAENATTSVPQARAMTRQFRRLLLKPTATGHQRDDLNCFFLPTGGHPFAKNASGLAEREILIFLYFKELDCIFVLNAPLRRGKITYGLRDGNEVGQRIRAVGKEPKCP